MIVYHNREIFGTIGGGSLEKSIIDYIIKNKILETIKLAFDLTNSVYSKFLSSQKTGMVCGGSVEVLIERLHNPYLLYIIGAGHCGIELSRLAKSVGFYITVIDHRKEWANKEKHPSADKIIVTTYKNIQNHINFTDNTYIVIMTHNHEYDEMILKKCLKKKHKYLGMIGSQNKVKDCFQRLIKKGFSKKELSQVFSPIGFAIGSITPSEIAISIISQMLAVKNNINTVPFNSNPFLK